MKTLALLAVIWTAGLCAFADSTNSWERFSPHFSKNTRILWQPPTNHLPNSLWIYQRVPPRPFSATVISNAGKLASLEEKSLPQPSTNAFFIWSKPNPCGMSFSVFSLQPASATITFQSPNPNLSTSDIPSEEAVRQRALACAQQLGLDPAQLILNQVYCLSNAPGCDRTLTNGVCGRSIGLSRKLDGISFYGDVNNGSEGFSIEFGSHGQIRSFFLMWPNLEPDHGVTLADPEEIIRNIRAHKAMVVPDEEPDYFGRMERLSEAKTFTITKVTPRYAEGRFGEEPIADVPPKYIAPLAELEAVADFGKSNVTVRLIAPIISSEFSRLPGKMAE